MESVRQTRAEVATAAAALSRARRAAAGQLRVAVEACLADLAMAGSRFDVRIGWLPDPKAIAFTLLRPSATLHIVRSVACSCLFACEAGDRHLRMLEVQRRHLSCAKGWQTCDNILQLRRC